MTSNGSTTNEEGFTVNNDVNIQTQQNNVEIKPIADHLHHRFSPESQHNYGIIFLYIFFIFCIILSILLLTSCGRSFLYNKFYKKYNLDRYGIQSKMIA